MNAKDLKIGTQLKLGSCLLLLFVVVLGVVSYTQNEQIHQQTEIMYNHPLKVRRAIDALSDDVLQMLVNMRGLPHADNNQEISEIIEKTDIFDADTKKQLEVLYERFLGPRTDVDAIANSLVQYRNNRAESIRLLREGKKEDVVARLKPLGAGGIQATKALDCINPFLTL